MNLQKINKLKSFKILIGLGLLLISVDSFAWRVHKHRDQLRFGYGVVIKCTTYDVGSNGNLYPTGVDITCRDAGELKCRRGASNAALPANDLESCDEYTAAE
ncbi:MAG: hypothetical protein IT243_03455 [Bacteroidia bacterium]|nr:hypothetical protein [Bacteroidia bacterium]